MYNRSEQIEILKSVKVKEGTSRTMDCPFCLGKRKFSITNDNGTILWNCYKASCGARGAYRKGMSLELIKDRLDGSYERPRPKYKGNPIPEILSKPTNHPRVMDYLKRVNCLSAFNSGQVKIRYAPADDRCLFFVNDNYGAVGRSMSEESLPKWMTYGDTSCLFEWGKKGTTGVIVEDVPSACAVGSTDLFTGIALLGTNLGTKHKHLLKSYESLVIALDSDAKKKSLLLLEQLQGLNKVTVRFLTKDLKYCSREEITKVMSNEV